MGSQDKSAAFCPQCGGRLITERLKPEEPERKMCGQCGSVFYLDPKVVACCLVLMGNRIALLRRGIEPQKSMWVLPGGYVDRGEPVTDAAIRETREECSLVVKLKELLGVYSYPGDIHVIVVYLASPLEGCLAAGDETQEAKWFSKEEIPWDELAFKSTEDALRDYLRKTNGNRKEVRNDNEANKD